MRTGKIGPRRVVSWCFKDRSFTRSSALDECDGRLGALDRVACCHVIGIARQHEQLRVWDDLLPGPRLVHTGEPASLRGDDQCGASNLRYVAPDIGASDGLHKANLGRDGGAAHEFRPPLNSLRRKVAAEATGHALAGPRLDTPRFECRGERRSVLCRTHTERRWCSDYRQGAHTRRTARRKSPSDGATDLGAYEMEPLDAQRIHEAAEVVDQAVEGPGVFSRHGRGRTETTHIRTYHAISMRELRNPPVPRSAALRVAVQHKNATGIAPGVCKVVDQIVEVKVRWNAQCRHVAHSQDFLPRQTLQPQWLLSANC